MFSESDRRGVCDTFSCARPVFASRYS